MMTTRHEENKMGNRLSEALITMKMIAAATQVHTPGAK